MRRRRAVIALAFALVAVSLLLAACGDGDDEETSTSPAPSQIPAPGGSATPPSAGALPPEFVQCMAAQGYDVESSAGVHSAPQEVLRACFGSLHEGGGAPRP